MSREDFPDASAGFRLSGVIPDDEDTSLWLGDYHLAQYKIPGRPRDPREMYREVMGRPAYQHRDLPSRWLVWTGVMWLGLLTEDLPWGYGIRMEAGMSDFDRAQDERPQTPTLSLQEDVAGPDQGRGAWRVADGGQWSEAPSLTCASLTEDELQAAEAAARSKARPADDGKPLIEVCHCSSCGRQGADITLKMLRHFGAVVKCFLNPAVCIDWVLRLPPPHDCCLLPLYTVCANLTPDRIPSRRAREARVALGRWPTLARPT